MPSHYLSSLFAPGSIALVGASEREGSVARVVYENLVESRFSGPLFLVNPLHKRVLGQTCHARLGKLPQMPELAIIVSRASALASRIQETAEAGIRHILLLPYGRDDDSSDELNDIIPRLVKEFGLQLLGGKSFGVVRPAIGFNAVSNVARVRAGSLALLSQSNSVCSALLDWAMTTEIGFSSVIALGDAQGVDIADALDFLLHDPDTKSILLHFEHIQNARRLLSALRAAARVKPVVVLKSGRQNAAHPAEKELLASDDAVTEAALRRSGVVRVSTSLQLFAAARLLADPRHARYLSGGRLAIISNGTGPAVAAMDSIIENNLRCAELSKNSMAHLERLAERPATIYNPLDLGAAAPQGYSEAIDVLAADANVDAVLVLHSPGSTPPPEAVAEAVIESANRAIHQQAKPVFAAWLGGASIVTARRMFDAAGVPNFLTPENAIEAFSYLSTYRRQQKALLESVPASDDLSATQIQAALGMAQSLYEQAIAERQSQLDVEASIRLCEAFGLPVVERRKVRHMQEATNWARKFGYPIGVWPKPARLGDQEGVFVELANDARQLRGILSRLGLPKSGNDVVESAVTGAHLTPMPASLMTAGIMRDACWGPVIYLGPGSEAISALMGVACALPPLNALLADDLIVRARIPEWLDVQHIATDFDRPALIRLLIALSGLVCHLPWVRSLKLEVSRSRRNTLVVSSAHIMIDQTFNGQMRRYAHLAISPYPVELEQTLKLRGGQMLKMRAIRPEDADAERAFLAGLSDATRFSRFMHAVTRLSDEMIARFTQLDYDREMALVALTADESAIVGVARYFPNPDHESVEFAVTVADAWQGQGIGESLMRALLNCARQAGYRRIVGQALSNNRGMLKLGAVLGFEMQTLQDEATLVSLSLVL